MYFSSRRTTAHALHGMVATSEPLAAMAGLRILMDGGNAVDGAVAAAAALAVVEPFSTGVGGDLFALVWMDREKQVRALNASGRAPAAASLDQLHKQGIGSIGSESPYSITVPGTVDGWHGLLSGYGNMGLTEVLRPAIRYAEEGYPAAETISRLWAGNMPKLQQYPSGAELTVNGHAPGPGETVRLPELAGTLRTIAEGGRDAFYKGALAEKAAAYVQEKGGWLTAEDMAAHYSTWEEPLSTDYRGVTLWECRPNTHGIAAQMALNIAEGYDLADMGFQSADAYHCLIEAMRLSYADAFRYIADPAMAHVPMDGMLSKDYAAQRRELIRQDRAMSEALPGHPSGDTVYVACVDGEGNACSLINSLFHGFGTGLVVPGTGMALHNRGSLFSLQPDHPNSLEPGKRPYHTIMPGLTTKRGELDLCFGVMGGFQQPQGHLQVMVNMVDFGLEPQEALDALRFSVQPGAGVALEEGLDPSVVSELMRRGHQAFVLEGLDRIAMGGGQIVRRNPATSVLSGGSEPRKDGIAVGW